MKGLIQELASPAFKNGNGEAALAPLTASGFDKLAGFEGLAGARKRPLVRDLSRFPPREPAGAIARTECRD